MTATELRSLRRLWVEVETEKPARQARGLRHITRCPKCGAWCYRDDCPTPHDREKSAA